MWIKGLHSKFVDARSLEKLFTGNYLSFFCVQVTTIIISFLEVFSLSLAIAVFTSGTDLKVFSWLQDLFLKFAGIELNRDTLYSIVAIMIVAKILLKVGTDIYSERIQYKVRHNLKKILLEKFEFIQDLKGLGRDFSKIYLKDIDLITGIAFSLTNLLRSLILLLVYCFFAFIQNPLTAIFAIGIIASYTLLLKGVNRKIFQMASSQNETESHEFILSQDLLHCFDEIKAHGRSKFFAKKLLFLNKKRALDEALISIYKSLPPYGLELFVLFAFSIYLAMNSWQLSVTSSSLLFFAFVALRIRSLSTSCGMSLSVLAADYPYWLSFKKIVDGNDSLKNQYSMSKSNDFELRLEKINFSYDKRRVLNNVNLCFRSGDRVLVCGESGSGKTTLLKLISGVLSLQSGKIYCGIDRSLRSAMFSNHLIHGGLFENVRFGRHLSEEQIIEALDIVQFPKEIILKLMAEKKYRRKMLSLSEGQKQRILLARSIAAKPALLILDEALTNISHTVKVQIVERIWSFLPNSIIIVASHDLSLRKFFNKELDLNNEILDPLSAEVLLSGHRSNLQDDKERI